MQKILDAILNDAPAEEFASIEIPESYRAITVHKDDVGMFADLPTRDKDPRKSLHLDDVPVPELGPGEALVRIRRIGVCGTDMHIYQGNQPYFVYPRVMGHELSAEVVTAPKGSDLKAGDAVYIVPYLHCGHCVACRAGRQARAGRDRGDVGRDRHDDPVHERAARRVRILDDQ